MSTLPAGRITAPRILSPQVLARCLQGFSWRRAAVVVLFCALYGGSLSLDPKSGGPPRSLVPYLVGVATALAYFLPMLVAVSITAGFAPANFPRRAIALGLGVVAGVAIGDIAATALREVMSNWNVRPPRHLGSLLPILVTGWVGVAIYLLHERDEGARQTLHDEAERRLNLERQVSEAQLQVLQSQIEPHFLFNSLAHVRRLYRSDPATGKAMLRHLAAYLGTALPVMREPWIELGRDLDLAVAYLNVQQIRMGHRLAVEINVSVRCRAARVPPMTIATLAENSIKHGLSPLPEGGTIRIVARHDNEVLEISVSDDGRGFEQSLGTGVGLSNARARLSSLHGAAAQLELSRNVPRGVVAVVRLPMPRSREPA
jgi:hypothetical protein